MLQEILLLMERRFTDLGVTVATDLPEPIVVEAFPAELRQVFTNLITNAAEAAGPGGRCTSASHPQSQASTPTGQKQQAGATVIIADNGPGIPDEVQPHSFSLSSPPKASTEPGLACGSAAESSTNTVAPSR